MKINAWWCMLLEKYPLPPLWREGIFLILTYFTYILLTFSTLRFTLPSEASKGMYPRMRAFLLPFLPSNCPILLARNGHFIAQNITIHGPD